jgi:hypothetical protein
MIKKVFILLIVSFSFINAQSLKFGEAKGLFFSVGVGPRLPLNEFSSSHNLGVGIEGTVSYTDNKIIPFFAFTKFEFNHFPGSLSFYETSEHITVASNILTFSPGVRFYLPPIIKDIVILMPVLEFSGNYGIFSELHEFDANSNREDFTKNASKYGFTFGAGFSMFLLDVIGNLNYYDENQYLSVNLAVRIPLFVQF